MILTIAVRLAEPPTWVGSDDVSYFSAAEHVAAGEPIQRLHHQYSRMAIVAPTALSIRLFGASPVTVALPQLVASILCVALVAVLGRLIWGWWEGLCAATIVSVLPYYLALSTVAYPDTIACFFASLAVMLAFAAYKVEPSRRRNRLGLACGLALGMAMSAKVFTATGGVAILLIAAMRGDDPWRKRVGWLMTVALASLAVLVAEGLFYAWAANDFLYRFHALCRLQTSETYFPKAGFLEAAGVGRLMLDRLTMPLNPGLCGWGRLGALFLPSAFVVLLFNRRGRPLAVWALATYFLVAFIPVSFHNGPQPYPIFHGRHILPSCIPFALCLAWLARRAAGLVTRETWIRRAWPVVFAGIAVSFLATDHDVSGFHDRPTARIGQAIERMVASGRFEGDRAIFMTPATYWRYRILFPPKIKARLRVAVDENARDWWRYACYDIASREEPLPPPERAYLLATPLQLSGQSEWWDYGVPLPADRLGPWQSAPPIVTMARVKGVGVRPVDGEGSRGKAILTLVTAAPPDGPGVEVAAAGTDRAQGP